MRYALVGLAVLAGLAALALVSRGGGSDPPAAGPAGVDVRRCSGQPYSSPPFASSSRDLVAGPLRVVSFLDAFADAREEDVYTAGDGATKVLKAAVNIVGSRDVAIVVPRSERRLLSLDYDPEGRGQRVRDGRPAVRFEACPHGRRTTGYAGAWLYEGPWPACVTLEFRVEGRRDPILRRVPLGAGRCAQPV